MATKDETDLLQVAYHDGPPEIAFFGMDWARGRAQPVTPMQWQGMQLRSDFKAFDFRVGGSAAPAASPPAKPSLTPSPSPEGRGENPGKGV